MRSLEFLKGQAQVIKKEVSVMARSQGRQNVSRKNIDQRQLTYIQGSAARQLDVKTAIEEPRRELSHSARKNREKANNMSLGYVAFLAVAMLISGFVLINYIQLQFDITNNIEYIASLESQLNNLKQDNDETYTKITSSVDLEEIKRIAIGELGMTYAAQGQIIMFTNNGSDYVTQYADIPQ